MQRKVAFAEGEYYHLYSRGVEKRWIFLDSRDRQRFIKLLYVANGENSFVYRDIEKKSLSEIQRGKPLVSIGAYVLMDNHFHILVKEISEGGITSFMEKLLTGYASYFNKRHKRTGTLFQGRYQAQHIHRDEHLKYLFAYIHLNPVKKIESNWKEVGIKNNTETKRFLSTYKYSSYLDYIGLPYVREESEILSRHDFPRYFLQKADFSDFIEDWLTLKDINT